LQPTFRRNISPPSSGSKKWFSKNQQLNRLHGVISQKMILFITTAVETSNPTRAGIAIGYGLDDRGSIPGRGKIFLSYIASSPAPI
jgi:hypothetical protein